MQLPAWSDKQVSSIDSTGNLHAASAAGMREQSLLAALEKQRQEKRAAGIDFENDYANKLSGGKPPTGKKFSPFGGAKKNASKQIGGSGDVMSF